MTSELGLEQVARLAAGFNEANVAFAVIDRASGDVISANSALEHLFGAPDGGLNGKNYLDLFADESRIEALAKRNAMDDAWFSSINGEHDHRDLQGNVFRTSIAAANFVDSAAARPLGIAVLQPVRSIPTDEIEEMRGRIRHQAESFSRLAADLEIAKRTADEARLMAENANRAKSEFLANMSHELRTPLNAVIGFAQMMAAELFGKLGNDRYREYCNDILASGSHLLDVVNELLDLSKIESGRMNLEDELVDLTEIIHICRRLIQDRATRKQITISTQLSDLPMLMGDQRAFRQIMLNLLSNAVKFTETGGRVDIIATRTPSGTLKIDVVDTGIGIPEDEIEQVLEPFTQARNSRTTGETGSGLGLSIVKSLVDLHGGQLRIKSAEAVGTTVSIAFPPERVIATDETQAILTADSRRTGS